MCSESAYFPDAFAHSDDRQSEQLVEQDVTSLTTQPTDVSISDEELLGRVAQGSKEALALMFRRHRSPVLNVAKRILRDESEAEDLCQEVFLLLFQRARLFDAERGSASSWIIQIAY